MSEAVRKTGNEVLIDKYAQKTSMRLGVSTDSVRSEFRKRPRTQEFSSDNDFETEAESEISPPSIQEITLIKLILHDDENLRWTRATLNLDWISHARVREIISRRFELHHSHEQTSAASFLTHLENAEERSLVTQALADERPIAEPEKF